MSILQYNGGSVVAMAGEKCVGIAADTRFGVQAQTLATDYQRVFPVNRSTLLGLAGLASDVDTCRLELGKRHALYEMRERRPMAPKVFNQMISSYLYEHRFGPYFVEPIVAGLDPVTDAPFLCASDLLGSGCFAKDFVVSGTAENSLYGTCETFYKPNMDEEQLFETLSQCLLSAVDRDCLSGWGGVVHILTPERLVVRHLKGRQD